MRKREGIRPSSANIEPSTRIESPELPRPPSVPIIGNSIRYNKRMQQPKATVLFVGTSGSGKSALCNFLHDLGDGHRLFEEGQVIRNSDFTTRTFSTRVVTIKNSVTFSGSEFVFIDTPSINELLQLDLDFVRGLCQTVKTLGEINVIVLVIPFAKLDVKWKNSFCFFRDAFLPLFVSGHACVALTHMCEDDFEKIEDTLEGFPGFANKFKKELCRILGTFLASWWW